MNRFIQWLISLFCKDAWKLKSEHLNSDYGGTVTKINDTYIITSRTNKDVNFDTPKASKALISYDKKHKPLNGRRVSYTFNFRIDNFNFNDAPDWWVLFQDWTRVVKGDSNGNRPITTLEVKSYGEKLYIRHKDSSFQWDTSNKDRSPRNNGGQEIFVGVDYKVEVIITDGTGQGTGNVSFLLDDDVITNVGYQTKSATQWRESVQEIGIYHANDHNRDCKPESRVSISVKNPKRIVL